MIKDKLDDFLEKALINYDLPGLAVSAGTISGSTGSPSCSFGETAGFTYRKALGYKDLVTKAPLLPEHIFHMASVTKLFVGTSILLLREKGLIDLDGALTDYLPWFQLKDDRYRLITIRHLLSHTAGLTDVQDYHWDKPETDEGALERYVRSREVLESSLLWSPSDGKFSYSNIGYEILGVVIATVSGMPFEEYVRENIFRPLEMHDSTLLTYERGIYEGEQAWPSNLCTPHEKDEQKNIVRSKHFPYNRAHGPSSTLTSNVTDLEKWGLAHLGKKVLKKETYDLAWTPQALVPNNGEQICLGWFCREQNGFTLFGHEGTDDGFRASFWICPERSLYLIVCSNISNAPVKKISKQVFDLICSE
ncbi:serine hydrolase domain-containing protein [Sinanaerobacter chloroacetimidivorans]|jgi:CubicO group peptidase (beta-lactamase class C family)|uniref:Beta-lactamase family protein n=1 Tax=Sinanaerobacter chloroacetimidivorans TaxID=2818044 RepID=A0A8J8B183_9FIRM|nr:serine hydrolase domain-containing protein [Sinanaerobacter chloroacetimidivorans]MBR0597984.1 beta-lactamase family protein [Sinanaerobacter chloroacetimidivorans]